MKKVVAVLTVMLICFAALVACTPSADSLEKKFEKKDYAVVQLSAKDVLGVDESKVDYVFSAKKGVIGGESIVVVCFKNGSDASDYYKKLQDNGADKKTIAKKGNAVATGTEDAIKLFK